MSKPIKRQCPACQKTREFRADQKTCGCKGQNSHLASVPKQMDERVKRMLLGKKLPLTEVANKLDVAPKVVEEAVERLAEAGHNIQLADNEISIDKALEPGGKLVVDSMMLKATTSILKK